MVAMEMTRKIAKKFQSAMLVVRQNGVLELGVRTLQYTQKKVAKKRPSTLHQVYTGAIYDEILTADIHKPANRNWKGTTKKQLTFNWLMPPPGEGSGGHMTIFRFIEQLEKAGHVCRIYFHNPGKGSTVEAVKAVMGNAFPKVKAEMQWLWQDEDMAEADGIFATSWQTAYTVYNSKVAAKKFYFVQDFEPYFYPIGSLYILAENTYRLGLRGITAGNWLKKVTSENYGMVSDGFAFGSDSKVYHFAKNKDRKAVVFYARPFTERRAFELGVLTLDLFHRKHPDYEINFVGWDISAVNIPFPYNNLGILTPAQLNEVYNKCSAALVMSLTNASLLPLELLSSGCIPVVNEGDNNRLVINNEHIIKYCQSDPASLAEGLSEIVSDKDLLSKSQVASNSVKSNDWSESIQKTIKIIEKSVRAKGEL